MTFSQPVTTKYRLNIKVLKSYVHLIEKLTRKLLILEQTDATLL